jgi:hypothetical protein
MDNSFHQQRSNTQGSSGSSAGWQIFNRILNWLAGFIGLTEDEQKDAGIYLGDQRYK